MRVAIYVRVSTSEQSTDLQRIDLQKHAEARGWNDITFYEDKATGTNTNRPEFKRLMLDARARRFDLLLVWKLDRVARSLKDLILTLQELSELRVDFVSLRDNLDLTTSAGRLMLHIVGAFAQFEADLIKERVLAGLAAAKAKGTQLGRPARLNQSQVVELRQQGRSLNQIARELGVTKSAVSKTLQKIEAKNSLNKFEITQPPKPNERGRKN